MFGIGGEDRQTDSHIQTNSILFCCALKGIDTGGEEGPNISIVYMFGFILIRNWYRRRGGQHTVDACCIEPIDRRTNTFRQIVHISIALRARNWYRRRGEPNWLHFWTEWEAGPNNKNSYIFGFILIGNWYIRRWGHTVDVCCIEPIDRRTDTFRQIVYIPLALLIMNWYRRRGGSKYWNW